MSPQKAKPLFAALAASLVVLFLPGTAPGATFTVTSTADPGDGVCTVAGTGDGCTLREAITAANGTLELNTITFAANVSGTIILNASRGPLVITQSVRITGPGARVLAVSGDGVIRVFSLTWPGVFSGNSSRISGLTIRDGRVAGTAGVSVSGGGINVAAETSLALFDCTLSGHRAVGGTTTSASGAGGSGQGGAVFNAGDLVLYRCTFSGNRATGGSGGPNAGTFARGGAGGPAQGGAVFNSEVAALTINNCTFHGNSVSGGAGGNAQFGGAGGRGSGGAICNRGAMGVTATTCSVNVGAGGAGGDGSNNINDGATGAGNGGMAAENGTCTVGSALCAGNFGNSNAPGDVSGVFTSNGYNLIGSSVPADGFTAATDLTGTGAAPLNPNLGPLQNNGGPTNTLLLLPGSPAIDRGKSYPVPISDCTPLFGCFPIGPVSDQRALARTINSQDLPDAAGGDGTDIGAVEIDRTQAGPTFYVTTVSDHDDGTCSYGDGTLREAIQCSNNSPGPNTIVFVPSAVQFTNGMSLNPALGPLGIADSVTITGPGARQFYVSGEAMMRVFDFASGTSSMSGLTIAAGAVNSGGIGGEGAGILNTGILTLTDCTFSNNETRGGTNATPGANGGFARGGAVANDGTLLLERCTFYSNQAVGGNGTNNTAQFGFGGAGGAGNGGAVFNYSGATLTINNCTFFNNTGSGGKGGDDLSFAGGTGGEGSGGVFNQGTMTMTACTLSGNTGTGGAGGKGNNFINNGGSGTGSGGLSAGGGTSTVRNTLSAGNFGSGGPDVRGAFTSDGYNLLGKGDGSTGFTAPGDQSGSIAAPRDPKLGPLQNNGGTTDTMALLATSPAIDKGKAFSLTTDQRSLLRLYNDPAIPNAPGGDGSDTGAFELQPIIIVPPSFVSITRVGSALHMVIKAEASGRYQLQISGNLTPPFVNLGSPLTTNASGQAEFIDPGPLPVRRFYQVIQAP